MPSRASGDGITEALVIRELLAKTASAELQLLRGVFIEVPGTHVTCDQAARLAGIDPDR